MSDVFQYRRNILQGHIIPKDISDYLCVRPIRRKRGDCDVGKAVRSYWLLHLLCYLLRRYIGDYLDPREVLHYAGFQSQYTQRLRPLEG